ncbi:hypothetical protein AO265_16905 [Pseudomonas sp. ABAC61]|nr:hypothetical protein AO265_16905 [Pseudomonas sp. ABAC61]
MNIAGQEHHVLHLVQGDGFQHGAAGGGERRPGVALVLALIVARALPRSIDAIGHEDAGRHHELGGVAPILLHMPQPGTQAIQLAGFGRVQ